ncbi:LPS export ABC transporter permease LptG [Celeribacter sp.]|uniref:LPS export ABC transporter permease LptG n=1 Tax=Celeribacter sp. TaxID=1890673 RepID=UPI003A8D3812
MILDFYYARRFARALIIVLAVLGGLIMMIESIEALRRYGDTDLPATGLLYLASLRLPATLYDILPIVVVLSTLVLFLGMARSSELVVTRAAGRSVLRALVPPLMMAMLFGVFAVAVIGPVAATATRTYEQRTDELRGRVGQAFSVSSEGLWLREGDELGQTVIRAGHSNLDGSALYDVSFLAFGPDGTLVERIEAGSARIYGDEWILTDAKRWPLSSESNPEAAATTASSMTLPTALTLDEIRDRFGTPKAVSIWDLPAYIEKLETAGFSARAYRMWMQSSFALPLTFAAMMLIGAGFTMRHTRLGGTATLVVTAILLSFGFFFLRSFALILGENGEIPVLLAAWGPPVAVILASTALLLHLEDG